MFFWIQSRPAASFLGRAVSRRFRRSLLVLAVLVLLLVVDAPGSVFAQQDDPCTLDPNSRECVCATVARRSMVPKEFGSRDPITNVRLAETDPLGSMFTLEFDKETGNWYAKHSSGEKFYSAEGYDKLSGSYKPTGLKLSKNKRYKEQCALAYLRLNVTRGWYFAVAFVATIAGITMVWLGFDMTRAAAAGEDLSKVRINFFKVLVGFVVVGAAGLIWIAMADATGIQDVWRLEDIHYDLGIP